MWQNFRKFIMRGNVVDLAVAVVIGAAFGAVVSAVVADLLTPLIAAVFGQEHFANLSFTLNDSTFNYGDLINKLISFLAIAVTVFFLVVQPLNKLIAYSKRHKQPADPTNRKCPECLSDIPLAASRCAFCTAKVKPIKK